MPNPFNATFGESPRSVIEREKEIQLIRNTFSDESPESRVYVLTGPRGSGKTALLTTLKNSFEESGFLTIDLNLYEEMLEQLASKLFEAGKLWKLFLHPEFSFSFKGMTFSIKGKSEITNVFTLLERMFSYLKKKNKRVLITVDDVSPTQHMKSFVYSFQQFIRGGAPIFLLMSGLYENVSTLERDRSLTFFLRAPKLFLEPLDLSAITFSYKKILNLSVEESAKIAKMTNGYAYGYQLLGSLIYKNGLSDNTIEQYDLKLSENAYSLIWEKLTEREKEIVFALNKTNTAKELCEMVSMDNGSYQKYRKRLIDKGIIKIDANGRVSFLLPRFKEFVALRAIFEAKD